MSRRWAGGRRVRAGDAWRALAALGCGSALAGATLLACGDDVSASAAAVDAAANDATVDGDNRSDGAPSGDAVSDSVLEPDAFAGCTCSSAEVCVKYVIQSGAPGISCVPIAPSCDGGVATCACMADAACGQDGAPPPPNVTCMANADKRVITCVDVRP